MARIVIPNTVKAQIEKLNVSADIRQQLKERIQSIASLSTEELADLLDPDFQTSYLAIYHFYEPVAILRQTLLYTFTVEFKIAGDVYTLEEVQNINTQTITPFGDSAESDLW